MCVTAEEAGAVGLGEETAGNLVENERKKEEGGEADTTGVEGEDGAGEESEEEESEEEEGSMQAEEEGGGSEGGRGNGAVCFDGAAEDKEVKGGRAVALVGERGREGRVEESELLSGGGVGQRMGGGRAAEDEAELTEEEED